jgi:glycerate 2-kinase
MTQFNLSTHTLDHLPWGAAVQRVLQTALDAVDPGAAVERNMRVEDQHWLYFGHGPETQSYNLHDYAHIYLIGAGKAGAPMAQAAASILGESLSEGVVLVKTGYTPFPTESLPPKVTLLEAAHPIPDERGIQGTCRVLEMLANTGENDLVICLLSGGGSALLTQPAPGIHLDDLQVLTRHLLACGATIHEINSLRKHLDTVKGGGLARAAAPAQMVTLILSDVVGDPLEVIASGPTTPDPSTFRQAVEILERYLLLDKTPASIRHYLEAGVQGLSPETPKPGDPLFRKVFNLVIGSNRLAAQAAANQARQEGFTTLLLTTFLQGEARQAGKWITAIARQIHVSGDPLPAPLCLVAGGETTVTLSGDGLGGRNQELALSAVEDLDGLPDTLLVTLATDGGDGPTDAAGAVVNGESLSRARSLGLQPAAALARNDSYPFFEALGDLLKTGPTRTNVNDLTFLLIGPPGKQTD